MLHASGAIILSFKRHTESSYIVNAFTEKHGIIHFSIRLSPKKRTEFVNTFNVLNFVELVYVYKEKQDSWVQFKEVALIRPSNALFDIHHNALKLFIAEVVLRATKTGYVQPELYSFMLKMVQLIDSTNKDFVLVSIYFLTELFGHLGISLTANKAAVMRLNITQEELSFLEHMHNKGESIKQLNIEGINLFDLFDKLIAYFKLEYSIHKPIHSLDVFREIYYQ